MSLLANFDLVFEVTADALLRVSKSSFSTLLGGTSIEPPFEFDAGPAHIIVETLRLDFVANDTVNLTFGFDDTTIDVLSRTADALDGEIVVSVPINNSANDLPKLNLPATSVTITFSPMAQNKITAAGLPLGGLLGVDTIGASLIQNFCRNQMAFGLQSVFNNQIALDTSGDGHLYTGTICSNPGLSLQVVAAEAHGITDVNTGQQFLAIFCTVLKANSGKGSAALKTTTAIPTGDDLTLSLSPEIFQKFFFCPAIVCADPAHNPANLPPPLCGNGRISVGGDFFVTALSFTFNNGFVDLNGSVRWEPTCYTGTADLHARVSCVVTNGYVSFKPELDPANWHVSVDGWCYAVSAIVGGPIGVGIVAGVQSSAESFGSQTAAFVSDMVAQAALGGLFKTPSGIIDQVLVSPEALTVAVRSEIPIASQAVRGLSLEGSPMVASKTAVPQPDGTAQGTLVISSGCMTGNYPFTDYTQQIVATYTAKPVLLGRPLKLDWWLSTGTTTVKLPNSNGTVPFDGVVTYFDLSSIPVSQTVHVDYTITDDVIVLKNHLGEGSFSVGIDVIATDPVGRSAEAFASFTFQGDYVEIGGGYMQALVNCLQKWLHEVSLHNRDNFGKLSTWVPVNYPAPDTLRQFFANVASSGSPVAAQVLTFGRIAHGASFNRMLTAGRFSSQFSSFRIANAKTGNLRR